MKFLSIQSAVAYGHVGNSAAVFPLQRMGHEVWPVYTVNFSNHLGHGMHRGPVLAASQVRDVVMGMDELGVLAEVDVVLSGYQGSSDITDVILDTVARVKELNPHAVYVADPVMGNATDGFYVEEGIPPLMRDAVVPTAYLLTPNHFELGVLTGVDVSTLDGTIAAIKRLRARGPRVVLVTSVFTNETAPGTLDLLVADESGLYKLSTPRFPGKVHGTGDVTTALFSAHYLTSKDPIRSLEATASSVYDLIDATLAHRSRELLLVQSQDKFVHPALQFTAQRVTSTR